MANEKTKDTLFIDMKYIILYRKLGYKEVKPDFFEYDYNDTKIIIESENQRYSFKGNYYQLLSYKDFVILECIDRLLKKGYESNQIRFDGLSDLSVYKNNDICFRIFVAQWGKDYKELLSNYKYDDNGIVVLYTSQLSGGLVDFISRIYINHNVYEKGIFDKGIAPYKFDFKNKEADGDYPKEFVVSDNELLKYLGHDKKVIIPEGIRRIGTGAFWNNIEVEEIILPDSVTCICGDTFIYATNLKKINIPCNVDEMGDDPFAGCFNIEIENNSPKFILEDGILFDKTRRFLIHYTASNKATRYVIPETVEWIGKHSFYKCQNLEEIVVTKNVKFMGNNAFSDCDKVHLVNQSEYFKYIDGVLYNKEGTQCMHYSMGSGVEVVNLLPTVRTIGRNCFWNCTMIKRIIIPQSVRQIGYNPFASCTNITFENNSPFYKVEKGILYDSTMKELVCCPSSAVENGKIIIPSTVINLGRNCFAGCDKLEKIDIPSNVKFISRSTFSNCTGLKQVVLPSSIEEIGDWCFNNCINLEKISIPKDLKLSPNTFNGCPNVDIIRY